MKLHFRTSQLRAQCGTPLANRLDVASTSDFRNVTCKRCIMWIEEEARKMKNKLFSPANNYGRVSKTMEG